MPISSQDILFASLMGHKSVGQIERFNVVQNELSKLVLPPIPFLPWRNETKINDNQMLDSLDYTDPRNWQSDIEKTERQQFLPLSFKFTGRNTKFLFPMEPMLTVSSGNTIAESNVSKQGSTLGGTVKERWSRNDFDITITGALFGKHEKGKYEDCYPIAQLTEMFEYLKAAKRIEIYSDLLLKLDITHCVVYDYSFPFTKGENVQAYEIKVKSDAYIDLLITEEIANTSVF